MSEQRRCSYGCRFPARFQVGDDDFACARHLAFYVAKNTSAAEEGPHWVKVARV